MHHANDNVQLLLDDAGVVVERYEYEPYGERTVYISPGSNDPDCHAPTLLPQRVKVGGIDQPYGICEFGHQGLTHDDASGLIYNRRRMLHPRFQRFMQRDPAGYVDGMLLYGGYHVMHGGLDPTGLNAEGVVGEFLRETVDPIASRSCDDCRGKWLTVRMDVHYLFGSVPLTSDEVQAMSRAYANCCIRFQILEQSYNHMVTSSIVPDGREGVVVNRKLDTTTEARTDPTGKKWLIEGAMKRGSVLGELYHQVVKPSPDTLHVVVASRILIYDMRTKERSSGWAINNQDIEGGAWDGGFVILNSKDRPRITLAHEIGHILIQKQHQSNSQINLMAAADDNNGTGALLESQCKVARQRAIQYGYAIRY